MIETELLSKNYYVYRWRQVPINTSVLGVKAENNRPEITQIIFKPNNKNLMGEELEKEFICCEEKNRKAIQYITTQKFLYLLF